MTFGSKRFEEQRAFRKRNETGTVIRNWRYENGAGGGERKETGRIWEVSRSIGNWIERFDPEGLKGPNGEWRSKNWLGCRAVIQETGRRYGSRPEPGLTGMSEGAAGRTILSNGRARQRSSRPGTLILEWWPGNGQSLQGSERLLRDVGSSRERTSGDL